MAPPGPLDIVNVRKGEGQDIVHFDISIDQGARARPETLRRRRNKVWREKCVKRNQERLRGVWYTLRKLSQRAVFREAISESFLELPNHARARIIQSLVWDREKFGEDPFSSASDDTATASEEDSEEEYSDEEETTVNEEQQQQQQQQPQQQQPPPPPQPLQLVDYSSSEDEGVDTDEEQPTEAEVQELIELRAQARAEVQAELEQE